MGKRSNAVSDGRDDLQPEYRFNYSKARPNPYADRLKSKAVAVLPDTEVAASFPTLASVGSKPMLRTTPAQDRKSRR